MPTHENYISRDRPAKMSVTKLKFNQIVFCLEFEKEIQRMRNNWLQLGTKQNKTKKVHMKNGKEC